jgi:hypothetical protein
VLSKHDTECQRRTASAADVEFLDMGQQDVAATLLAAEANGNGPAYSQCIFYVNDPHVHIGIPDSSVSAGGEKLVHFPDGSYQVLDPTQDANGNYTGNMGQLSTGAPTVTDTLVQADDTGVSPTGTGFGVLGSIVLILLGVAILF